MALTPEDIANKDFSRGLRGFNENEVNDFLDEINDNYARTLDDNAALKNQLAAAQEKVKYFSGLQDALNKSILIAQQTADQVKKDAEKERDRIIYDAENDAKKIIKAATDKANQIQDEAIGQKHELSQKVQEIESGLNKFHQQLVKTLQEQLEAANDQNWLDLLQSYFSDDLTKFQHYKSSAAYDDVTKSLLQENPDLKLEVDPANLEDATSNEASATAKAAADNFSNQVPPSPSSQNTAGVNSTEQMANYAGMNDFQATNPNSADLTANSQFMNNDQNVANQPGPQPGDPGFMVNPAENSSMQFAPQGSGFNPAAAPSKSNFTNNLNSDSNENQPHTNDSLTNEEPH